MRLRVLIAIFLSIAQVGVATTSFMESGSDATQNLYFWNSVTGTIASDTSQKYTGTSSIKFSTGAGPSNALMFSPAGVLSDAGTQISFRFRFDTLPAADAQIVRINNSTIANWVLTLKTTGILENSPVGATLAAGSKVLQINTWYRICISYYITSNTVFTYKVYVNGFLDSTANAGTLSQNATPTNKLRPFLSSSFGANVNAWWDDIYISTGVANSSSQPDTGDIRVTAKRPFANGTTNGFTGAGTPSGYGTGNARYVNEQPLSTTNNVSVVAAAATTEEYNVENKTVGNINLNGQSIVDYAGWAYATALLSETANMVINGNSSSSIALTSTDTMFENYAGSTSYPSGSGADIGIVTTSLATTVTLYECGILVAYKYPGSFF